MFRRNGAFVLALAVAASIVGNVAAQGSGGPIVSDSKVGYIDSALPTNSVRFRYDAAWDMNAPTRAEYFYAQKSPGGPGLPKAESRIDYQDLDAYVEAKLAPTFSVFLESALRFLNPQINDNSSGPTDLGVGFKYAFVGGQPGETTATFQLRTVVPTGAASRGLGTHHVSLEPGFLLFVPAAERVSVESEFRVWTPIGGTDFAGTVLRYGIGCSYEMFRNECGSVSPVLECVGWTVLDGKVSGVTDTGPFLTDAAGQTIVNVKLGVRFGLGERLDVYAGYGRSLTGDRWYEDIARLELKYTY